MDILQYIITARLTCQLDRYLTTVSHRLANAKDRIVGEEVLMFAGFCRVSTITHV